MNQKKTALRALLASTCVLVTTTYSNPKPLSCAAGGASNIYKPRSVGEGAGRVWYAPWSSGSAYGLMIGAGAKMTQMENKIVLARFKDGYGPVGAYFLHLKDLHSKWSG